MGAACSSLPMTAARTAPRSLRAARWALPVLIAFALELPSSVPECGASDVERSALWDEQVESCWAEGDDVPRIHACTSKFGIRPLAPKASRLRVLSI